MGTYEDLKAAIRQVIVTNGNNEITGDILQQTLLSVVNSVGVNSQFAGIATPETNPGTSDQNVFFIATTAGVYANFRGIKVQDGETAILSNKSGAWEKYNAGIATTEKTNELETIIGVPYQSVVFNNYFQSPYIAKDYELNLSAGDKTKFVFESVNETCQLTIKLYGTLGEIQVNYTVYTSLEASQKTEIEYIVPANIDSMRVYSSANGKIAIYKEFRHTIETLGQSIIEQLNEKVGIDALRASFPVKFSSPQDVTKLFKKGTFISYLQTLNNQVGIYTTADAQKKSMLFAVKNGDTFTFANLIGGWGEARAWIKYDLRGNVIAYADGGVTINGDFAIDYDGFFAVNYYGSNAKLFSCTTNSAIVPVNAVIGAMELAGSLKEVETKIKTLEDATPQNNEISILMFGNSFTQDSMSYVPFILQNIAPSFKVNIAIAYISGCTLIQHCANLKNESMTLNGVEYAPQNYILYYYEAGASAWMQKESMSAESCMKFKEWDVVTFQQAGGQASLAWETYYQPYIYQIQKKVFEKAKKAVKLGWLIIQGAYADSVNGLKNKWELSVENAEKVQNLTANQIIFPFGTAIQNLSTTDLANIGDGVGMTVDGGHLQEGLPCLCAAYANTLALLNLAGLENLSILGENTRPTKDWCVQKNIPGAHFGSSDSVVGITEENVFLAQYAAIQAFKKPYEITDCNIL